jgi:hypothetical protein
MKVAIERTVLQSGREAFKIEWEEEGAAIGGVYTTSTRQGAEDIKSALLYCAEGRIHAATRDAMIEHVLETG